ncbi:mast cell protease 1A-like [Ctenodactylus gundi]
MQTLPLQLIFLLLPWAEAEKIVGGQEAVPHSRPYMAFVQAENQRETINCGGFLVREDTVITAAHCEGRLIRVILGAHDIKMKEKAQQVILVKKAISHPNYQRKGHYNDIMLLQLQKNATLTTEVNLLELPKATDQATPGMMCSVAGWGNLNFRIQTDKLHEVNLEIQSDGTCTSEHRRYNKDIQMCVGNPQENKSPFHGDSGGPLVCNNKAQGVVSYEVCGVPPAVFTRISSFLPWIEKTMRSFKGQSQE